MDTGVASDPNRALELTLRAKIVNAVENTATIEKIIDNAVNYALNKIIQDTSKITTSAGLKSSIQAASGTDDKKERSDAEKTNRNIASKLDTIADVGVGFIKKTFNLVEMLFAQLKKSSPLLQAIEQLFNLAWTLFFMPIGNKLGEMLIPAVIQLMDDVMDIWDAFEGMSLGEMLGYAITKGVEILSRFIITIGEELSDQTGLVGSIGRMLVTVGNFLQKYGDDMLNTLAGVAGFILDHLKELIALIIAFKVASLTLMIQQIAATYLANSFENFFSGGLFGMGVLATQLAISGVVGAAAGGIAYAGMMADGGYVPATPGGQLAIVGEGGEGEYIFPESKLDGIGDTYNITVTSFSPDETKQIIKDVVSDEISKSRLRSGF